MANLPRSFKWIIPSRLAGSASPLPDELLPLKNAGIDVIVSLQQGVRFDLPGYSESYDKPLFTRDDALSFGMEFVHIPVKDHNAPSRDQIKFFIELMDANPDKAFLIHCYAGIGRTGTMAAAFMGSQLDISGPVAIDHVRDIFSLYIETSIQEDAVMAYLSDLQRARSALSFAKGFVDEALAQGADEIFSVADEWVREAYTVPDDVIPPDVPIVDEQVDESDHVS